MSSVAAWICLGLVSAATPDVRDSAADAVTLRDGKVVIGEVVEPAPRGQLLLVVRRDWARKHLPEWLDRWEVAEAPLAKRALSLRRDRLTVWRRDRGKTGGDDRISTWLDRELARQEKPGEVAKSPLIDVRLGRADVKSVARTAKGNARLLRLGWVSGFRDPEEMKIDDLKDAIQNRGFDVTGTSTVSIDALRTPQAETDAVWGVRRAATEVAFDSGLRFVRYQGMVFPEPAAGQPITAGTGLSALSALKDLLGENPVDPLAERLREVAKQGRVGAMVTKLDVSSDFDRVAVEMTLWVRNAGDRWIPAGSRASTVRPGDLGPEAGKDLAEDPQVALAFQAVEALGLGSVPAEMKQRSLGVGAATSKALGQARTMAEADLAGLSLPVLDVPKDKAPRLD